MLNATVETHIRRYDGKEKHLADKLLRDLCVDDSTVGVQSVDEGIEFYKFSKRVMKEIGFQLSKWCTNSKELINFINIEENSYVSTRCDENPETPPYKDLEPF